MNKATKITQNVKKIED